VARDTGRILCAMVEAHGAGRNLLGKEFGAYRIVRRLGIGGMAETFEAIRQGSDGFSQRVCLKLALPFLREDVSFIQLLQREARTAAKLRHSNIVGVLDYGSVDGTPYMALELVDGVDLRKLLDRETKLCFKHVSLLAIELAKGLSHAHTQPMSLGHDAGGGARQGVVHRDISPSNVMLSQLGEVLLTDFGVAKAMMGASHQSSAVKGKVPYMSPEQLRNEALDGRSDLFSLGVLLYESLSGSRPYDRRNDPETIMQILSGDRAPLAKLVREAPESFCEIVDSLIEPNRELRPATASELLNRLDELAPSPRSQRELGSLVSETRVASLPQHESLPSEEQGEPDAGKAIQSGAIPSAVVPYQGQSAGEPPEAGGLSVVLTATIIIAMLVGIFLFATRLI
jgi:serine/threonine protein kinase